MNSLPNNHHESLEPVSKEQVQYNRKQRRNLNRIKRKTKKIMMRVGVKIK